MGKKPEEYSMHGESDDSPELKWNLGPGDQGARVSAIQGFLAREMPDEARKKGLRIDSFWGPVTTGLVARLQEGFELEATGILDEPTRDKIQAQLKFRFFDESEEPASSSAESDGTGPIEHHRV